MKNEISVLGQNDLAEVGHEADAFCRLVETGISCWVEAGKLLMKALANDPDVFAKITKRVPYLTNDILLAFKRIGERKLYPCLLLDSSPASKKLALLPYDNQVELYGKPVKVAYINADGSDNVYETPPQRLSAGEADVVFSREGIRSVGDQLKILRAVAVPKKTKKEKPVVVTPVVSASGGQPSDSPKDQAKAHLKQAFQELTDVRTALEQVGKPYKAVYDWIEKTLTDIRQFQVFIDK